MGTKKDIPHIKWEQIIEGKKVGRIICNKGRLAFQMKVKDTWDSIFESEDFNAAIARAKKHLKLRLLWGSVDMD